MGQSPNDPNRGMLLLIHDMVCQIDEQLGEDFKYELRFEVFGGIGHDHRKCFFEAMEESLLVIALSEVNRQPVGDSFIIGGQVP